MIKTRSKVNRLLCLLLVGCCILTFCGCKGKKIVGEIQDTSNKATFTTEVSSDNQQSEEAAVVTEPASDYDPTKIIMIPKETLTPQRFTLEMNSEPHSSSSVSSIVSSISPANERDFTLMVYMVGSNLEFHEKEGMIGLGTSDIEEMLGAGVDFNKTNIIVYTGGALCWSDGIPSRYNCFLDLSKYNGVDNLRTCVVATAEGDLNMGSPDTFSSFLNFCDQNYPAKNYGLICWDHGGGPLSGFGADIRHENDSLTLPEMREAMLKSPFSKNHKLSFIGFDACLMGSIENAMIWKDYADYLMASEETEPGNGWDYRSLSCFNNNDDIKESLNTISYISANTMAVTAGEVTLSVMDLSKTDKVVESINCLFKSVLTGINGENYTPVQRMRYKTRGFGKSQDPDMDLVDIYDLADNLSALYPDESKKIIEDIDDFILCHYTNVKDSHGVSIYYPSDQLPSYDANISDSYRDVSPSSEYYDYLESYCQIWENDNNSGYSGNGDEGTTTQYIQDMIAFQLSDVQKQNYVSGYFNIYEKTWDGEYLRPIMLNCKIEPDDNGTILVQSNPKLICAKSDELEKEILWMVRQTDEDEVHQVYESIGTRLLPGADFDAISTSDIPVDILINIEKESGETSIVSITPDEQNLLSNSKAVIDLKKWDSIAQISANYQSVINSDGATLPPSEWEGSGMVEEPLALDNELGFELIPADKLDADLVCQVIIKDCYGNTGTSGLVPLRDSAENRYRYPTSGGELSFSFHDNMAILTDYDGEDEYLEVPSEIEGRKVTSIGSFALSGNNTLKEIILPTSIESIEASAFSGSHNIRNIELPASLKTIKAYAFHGCSSLESIIIPDGVEWIGKSAFSNCGALTSVRLPSSIKRIGKAVFSECSGLKSIEVPEGNDVCKIEGNVLISKDGKTVLGAPAEGITFVKIPEGVETIAYGAFAGCSELKMVQLPASLKEIENYAFYNCTGLMSLELPVDLEWIGIKAFGWYGDDIPLTEDERSVMESITIGGKVKYIGGDAFECFKNFAIKVADSNSEYASIDGFLTNKAGDYLMMAPSELSGSITIPDGIGGIASDVFRYNENITDVHIPASVTSISENAFHYHVDDNMNRKYSITIHGQAGSAAEKFAQKYNIAFIAE